MRIGIITFVKTLNFGASLQAYALQEVLKSFGADAEIITYVNEDIKNKENNAKPKNLKQLIRKLILERGFKRKKEAFQQYESQNINYGDVLNEKNEDIINESYDYFITGSDQVWNLSITHNDWYYFLSFVKDSKKKISYAPSFGNNPFPKDKFEMAKKYLSDFKSVSVREKSGADLVQKLIGKSVDVVVDPTLLLTKEEWLSKTKFIPSISKYILVYFPHDKKTVFRFVEKLKKKTGLPVVYLSISPRPQQGVKTIYDVSPNEFVGWIANAEYVVTGSFHGTAFSINLEKQFFYEPSGEGSRIDSLVKIAGLKERGIDNVDSLEQEIDYSIVKTKMQTEIEKSIRWLRTALNIDS